MDFLRHLLLVIHLLAFATLFGALLGQLRSAERKVTDVVVWGARIVFVAGILLFGVIQADDDLPEPDNAKFGAKLIVALVVVALAESNRKNAKLTDLLYFGLLGLTTLNVVIAVFWR